MRFSIFLALSIACARGDDGEQPCVRVSDCPFDQICVNGACMAAREDARVAALDAASDASAHADAAAAQRDAASAVDAAVPDAVLAPVCGNDTIEDGEQCDDGNVAYGDGCSSECLPEEQCVITHNGGAPLTLSSIKVSVTGSASVVGTTTLSGNDNADRFDERRAVAACGTHVYAAQSATGAIAQLESQADGSLVFVDDVAQAGVISLHCVAEDSTLLAISAPAASAAVMNLVTYSIASDGTLTQKAELPLTFLDSNISFRDRLPATIHPVTGELWVIGYFEDDDYFFGESRAFRIALDSDGNAFVAEGPLDIGASDYGRQIAIGNGGNALVMAGLSGGCTGLWSLPADGSLPSARVNKCSGNFSNGGSAAARSADGVFYQGHSGASVRIHEAGTGISFESEAATSSGSRLLELLYDDSVLFTVGRGDGDITVFGTSADGKTLTEVIETNSIPVASVNSVATVFCR